ncbi:hypothetical protein C8R43DRAFT_962637 [Mycena crocata]|nr:hypothetical protein C8R43DRAFT_962637 [Mycena crocata]
MPSLPHTFLPRVTGYSSLVETQYQRVLAFEIVQEALTSQRHSSGTKKKRCEDTLVCLRVLGQCLLQTESLAGLEHLALDIESSATDNFVALGKLHLKYFVKALYRAKGTTPELTEYAAHQEEHVLEMQAGSYLMPKPKRCSPPTQTDGPIIAEALRRTYHSGTFLNQTALEDATDREALRVLDFSDPKLTVLKIFGSSDELNGLSLENIMTVCTDIHDEIDSLRLWFEPTGPPNEYTVHVHSESVRPARATHTRLVDVHTVTFHSTPQLSAPSPGYLALHAACCRVAGLSGAASHLEKIEREFQGAALYGASHETFDALSRALESGYRGHSVGEI